MSGYHHEERLRLTPSEASRWTETPPFDINVLWERISTLTVETNETTTSFTPFPLQPLLDLHDLSHLLVSISSHTTDRATSASVNTSSSPAGVYIRAVFAEALSNEEDGIAKLLQDIGSPPYPLLLSHILQSAHPERQRRLHRYVDSCFHSSSTYCRALSLPTDGAASFSVEGVRRALLKGQWSLSSVDDWSQLLLGESLLLDDDTAVVRRAVRRRVRQELQRECSTTTTTTTDDTCTYTWKHTTEYSMRLPPTATTVALADVLPNTDAKIFQPNPLADQVYLEVPEDDLFERLNAWPCDTHRCLLSAKDPVSLTTPILQRSIDPRLSDTGTLSLEYALHRPAGLAHGGTLRTTIRNDLGGDCSTSVSQIRHRIPPVVKVQWQSLRVALTTNTTTTWLDPTTDLDNFSLHFEPAFGNTKLAILQWSYTTNPLPPTSQLSLFLDYDPQFLSIDVLPGDANRGIELPVVEAVVASHCFLPTATTTLFSNTVLLLPPLPDASMPFNVLSLVCTVYALVVGGMISWMVKRASEAVRKDLEGKKASGWKDRIKAKFFGLFRRKEVTDEANCKKND